MAPRRAPARKQQPPRTPRPASDPLDSPEWEGLVLADNTSFADPHVRGREVAYAKGTPLLDLPLEHAEKARANQHLVTFDEEVKERQLVEGATAPEPAPEPETQTARAADLGVTMTVGDEDTETGTPDED